jgi:hypothetical protein
MKKQFRSTFWSMETGTEWIQSVFVLGKNDSVKQEIVDFNRAKWRAIEPEVKEWVMSGWVQWERDKPDWFTDHWKASVPAAWVPMEGQGKHKLLTAQVVKGSAVLASSKKLVNVMGSDGGEEQGSTDEVRGGGRVQPVIR